MRRFAYRGAYHRTPPLEDRERATGPRRINPAAHVFVQPTDRRTNTPRRPRRNKIPSYTPILAVEGEADGFSQTTLTVSLRTAGEGDDSPPRQGESHSAQRKGETRGGAPVVIGATAPLTGTERKVRRGHDPFTSP